MFGWKERREAEQRSGEGGRKRVSEAVSGAVPVVVVAVIGFATLGVAAVKW